MIDRTARYATQHRRGALTHGCSVIDLVDFLRPFAPVTHHAVPVLVGAAIPFVGVSCPLQKLESSTDYYDGESTDTDSEGGRRTPTC